MGKNKISGLTFGVPAGAELVSLADFKAYAKITYTDEDTLITGLITTARQAIEREANISLMAHTITLIIECPECTIELPYPAINTVTSVSRMDSSYGYNVIDTDKYFLESGSLLYYGSYGRNKIIYTTIQGTEQIYKDAIKARTLALYEHRGDDEDIKDHPKWTESNLLVDRFRNFSWL